MTNLNREAIAMEGIARNLGLIPKLVDHQPHGRERAIKDAAEAVAEYLWLWGHREEQERTPWAVSVPRGFLEDIEVAIEDRLAEMCDEAAKERALDFKADELGMRY